MFLKFPTLCIFLPLEMQGSLKTLTSIRRNEANSDDLVSILKNVGVALSQDVIDAALKTVGPRGEYLMFLSTFIRSCESSWTFQVHGVG